MLSVETVLTVAEAQGKLTGDSRFFGGGTLVMRDINYGAIGFTRLIRTTDPVMRNIQSSGGAIRIGAGATMTDIMRNPDTAALAIAAHAVGGPAIRNMATVGGNLFAPHPYGDFCTALLALDAVVEWADGRSENLEQFLSKRDAATGVVSAVTIPRVSNGELRFAKVTRTRPKGVSLMSIAVRLAASSGDSPRIAFGAMGPTPLRAKAAESALAAAQAAERAGGRLTQQSAQAASQVCLQGLSPIDDSLASSWYRSEVAPVHLRRLLLNDRGYSS